MSGLGLRFGEFDVGSRYETASRLIGDAEIAAFAELSGDRNPLHLDEAYARGTVFGGRVAQGALGLAVATGLVNQLGLTRGTLVAFTGVEWRFRRPLFPGTRVTLKLEVASKRETRNATRGEVVLRAELCDEAGQVLQEGLLTFLVVR